jgi:hypothetical protein
VQRTRAQTSGMEPIIHQASKYSAMNDYLLINLPEPMISCLTWGFPV